MLTLQIVLSFLALASVASGDRQLSTFSGKWWTSPAIVRQVGLSADQQMRIDRIFQLCRPQLIELRASLEKEEALLDPLLDLEPLPEMPVLARIDRIAAARAELEKANARMLFAIRQALTPEQWRALRTSSKAHPVSELPK